MQTVQMSISPDIARGFLKNNTDNRPISMVDVQKYASDMLHGNWQMHHSGICIGKDGVLIDGQHRLTAVIKSGVTVEMSVTFDDTKTSPRDFLGDCGRKREESYILQQDKQLIAVARFAARVATGRNTCTTFEIRKWIAFSESAYDALHTYNKNTKRGISSADVQCAAIAHILLKNNPQYVIESYDALVRAKYEKMSPLVSSFFTQVCVDRIAFSAQEKFSKAMRVFDYERRQTQKLQVKNKDLVFDEARERLITAYLPLFPAESLV